ncbi:MAG: molybdopterin converting factor subunit 1 [Caldilineaceae bacterium]|nr:molybdopterin converting factor subunit 1 [Caldilineaceae bacterium]
MKLTVRLFATLRQEAGWSEQEIQAEEGTTVEALLARLDGSTEGLTLSGRPVYVAVNQEYAQGSCRLNDGDVVALFPPVSGGERARRLSVDGRPNGELPRAGASYEPERHAKAI